MKYFTLNKDSHPPKKMFIKINGTLHHEMKTVAERLHLPYTSVIRACIVFTYKELDSTIDGVGNKLTTLATTSTRTRLPSTPSRGDDKPINVNLDVKTQNVLTYIKNITLTKERSNGNMITKVSVVKLMENLLEFALAELTDLDILDLVRQYNLNPRNCNAKKKGLVASLTKSLKAPSVEKSDTKDKGFLEDLAFSYVNSKIFNLVKDSYADKVILQVKGADRNQTNLVLIKRKDKQSQYTIQVEGLDGLVHFKQGKVEEAVVEVVEKLKERYNDLRDQAEVSRLEDIKATKKSIKELEEKLSRLEGNK